MIPPSQSQRGQASLRKAGASSSSSSSSPLFVSSPRSSSSSSSSSKKLFSTNTNNDAGSGATNATNTLDPYYPNKTFYRFLPLAGIYTIVAHLALLLLKPFPFLLRNLDALPPKYQVRPEERFVLSSPPSSSMPSSSSSSSSSSTADRHIAIVTGSNTGIGFETASSLVELGYDVILACRSKDKGEEAAAKINSRIQQQQHQQSEGREGEGEGGGVEKRGISRGRALFLHPLDLSSLESVRSFTDAFKTKAKYKHLNILVNNAGINTSGTSVDGMDLCFQTNFVGHYLLTRLLLPELLTAVNTFPSKDGGAINDKDSIGRKEAGRVVNLSSVTHHFASANEERVNSNSNKAISGGVHDEEWWRGCTIPNVSDNTYKESKMAALAFTHMLNEKFGNRGLRAVSANPGSVNSDIWRNYPSYMMKLHNLIYLTSKQGSTTSLASAVGDLPKGAVYLQPYWQPWGNKRRCRRTTSGSGDDDDDLSDSDSDSKSSFQNWYSLPIPFSEMMSLYIGFAVTDCRLPPPQSSVALWNVCEELVGLKEKKTL